MGNEGIITAVVDAGPIIHLTEIDCLSLLDVFSVLHIPDAVWSETVGQMRVTQDNLSNVSNIKRHSLSQVEVDKFVTDKGLTRLDKGENECFFLCKQTGVSIILTDDMAVRDVAKLLNIVPVGSLGIVVKAYKSGQISLTNAEQCITALYDNSSLFVTKAIVEIAIEQLHKHN